MPDSDAPISEMLSLDCIQMNEFQILWIIKIQATVMKLKLTWLVAMVENIRGNKNKTIISILKTKNNYIHSLKERHRIEMK